MTLRLYLMPLVGDGTKASPRRGAYVLSHLAGTDYTIMDGGLEPVCLLAADVTAAQHTALSGESDVVALPTNLQATVGAQLATVQAALEQFNLPADWVTAGMTYRTVARGVALLFQFLQRANAVALQRVFASGVTLNTAFQDLPPGVQDVVRDTADALGVDRSGATGATTLRQILRAVSAQMRVEGLGLHGVDLT